MMGGMNRFLYGLLGLLAVALFLLHRRSWRRASHSIGTTRQHFGELTAQSCLVAAMCGIAAWLVPMAMGKAIAALVALVSTMAAYRHYRIAAGIDEIPPDRNSDDGASRLFP